MIIIDHFGWYKKWNFTFQNFLICKLLKWAWWPQVINLLFQTISNSKSLVPRQFKFSETLPVVNVIAEYYFIGNLIRSVVDNYTSFKYVYTICKWTQLINDTSWPGRKYFSFQTIQCCDNIYIPDLVKHLWDFDRLYLRMKVSFQFDKLVLGKPN